MEYRTLGRTGCKVSLISLGAEHLLNQPKEKVKKLLKLAIEKGVNYFDLIFAHPELRDMISSVLREMRESIFYAVHLGSVLSGGQYKKTRNSAIASVYFYDFLKRFRTDRADVLFLHSGDGQEDYKSIFAHDGLYDLARSLKEEGKARFLGFSGHTVKTTLQVIQKRDIDVLMFPINLASHRVEGKRELLVTCRLNKIGIVGMKPFAGGRLLSESTRVQLDFFKSGGSHYTLEKTQPITAVRCLSYALSQLGVCTVVPGFESAEELTDAFKYFVAVEEEKDYSSLIQMFGQYSSGECVYCNHCLPCPVGIDIATVMRIANASEYRIDAELRSEYNFIGANTERCVECGDCEKRCPFEVSVISKFRRLHLRMI